MNVFNQNAFLGSLVADAVAMPVHWYYDTDALDRDFPQIDGYQAPKKLHPDSILWRSKYRPRNRDADILHDQAKFWGQRNIHYHQFLPAGENTLNFLLAAQLYRSTVRLGAYEPQRWLEIYVESMRTPGWHQDTYVEEYHRAFFENRARGISLEKCGINDIHIGGLAPVPALVAALDALGKQGSEEVESSILQHVRLTHRSAQIESSALALVRMLLQIAGGSSVKEAILEHGRNWVSERKLEQWATRDDRDVVRNELSPACYLPDSFTASLFISWKYANDFSNGVIANARVGGDNCHRGAVVGSLLGAGNGIGDKWLRDLKSLERLRCDTLAATF